MLFEDCICFRLGALSRRITRTYKDSVSSLGLTHGQFFMLIALYDEDGLLPSQLAEKTALDRPTTSGLLERLERDGWIERRLDPTDRRAIRVHLTPKAQGRRADILATFEDINGRFLRKYSNREWQQLQWLLGRLEESEPAVSDSRDCPPAC